MDDAGIPLQQTLFYSMPKERCWLSVCVSNCHKYNILVVIRQTPYVEFILKDMLFAWALLGWHWPLQLPIKNCANQDCIMEKGAGRKTFHTSTSINSWTHLMKEETTTMRKPQWELPTACIVHWACTHQKLLLLPLDYLLFFHISAYWWTIISNNPKIHLAVTSLEQPSLMMDLSISNDEKHSQYARAGS